MQEISEDPCARSRENGDWFSEVNSFPLIPSGVSLFARLMAHACIKKRCELDQKQKYFTRREYLYCARYVGFDCKSEGKNTYDDAYDRNRNAQSPLAAVLWLAAPGHAGKILSIDTEV